MPTGRPGAPSVPSMPPNSGGMGLPMGAPRFEPIVTGKVVLAGLILGTVFFGAIALLWLG